MNYIPYYPAILSLILLLTGCAGLPGDPALQAKADSMSTCDKVEALVTAYDTGFAGIKGPSLSDRYLDIWAAKVNAVGTDCQVWKSGEHTTYMCTRNAPNEAVAVDWLEQASANIGSCLGEWRKQALSRGQGAGRGLLWTRAAGTPAVSVQLVPVRGDHWVLYYFVGDRDRWF